MHRVPRGPVGLVALACLVMTACTSSPRPAAQSSAPTAAATSAAPTTATPTSGTASATDTSGAAPATSTDDWPGYLGGPSRTGNSASLATAVTPRLLRRVTLDGQVLASPLVVDGLRIVATENDSVYAFDSSYRQVWKRSLGTPSPAQERSCGNIDPLGITGTPAYDAGTGDVYVVAETAGTVRHQLVALDLHTGAVSWRKDVDLPGVDAKDMQQRGALAIAHGKVWVPFGAQFGDCGNYKGRVVGVSLDGTGSPVHYSPPTQRGGGMWNPTGPVVLPGGDLLVVSANGAAFPGDTYDHTNSVLRIGSAGTLVDSFAPSDWAANNQGDVGLGSQGPVLVDGKWAVLGGKSGPVYVLATDKLGGIGGQVDVQDICRSFGGASVSGDTVYLPCTDGVRAVRVSSAGKLGVLWHTDSAITASPVVGGGRVWSLDPAAGVLHSLDPATGASLASVAVGATNRFAAPALSGSEVIVGTLTGFSVVSVR